MGLDFDKLALGAQGLIVINSLLILSDFGFKSSYMTVSMV